MNDSFCRIVRVKSRQMPDGVEAAVRLLDEETPCRLSHVIVKKKSPAVWMTRLRNTETRGPLRELEDRRPEAILKSISNKAN